MNPHSSRPLSWTTDGVLFFLVLLLLCPIHVLASGFDADALLVFALSLAPMPAALVLCGRLVLRIARAGKAINPMHDTHGCVTVEWILILPLFALIFLLIIQLALLGAAALVVQHAAFAAARSGIVALPENDTSAPRIAAALALTPIAPEGPARSDVGLVLQDVSNRQGRPWRFHAGDARFAFAHDALQLTFDPPRLSGGPKDLRARLTFPFCLSLPLANAALAPRVELVAGLRARFFRIHADVTLFSPGARTRMFGFIPGGYTP